MNISATSRRRRSVVCFIYIVAALAMAQGDQPQPDVNVIVARMMAAIQECKTWGRPLTVRRDYQLFDRRQESRAQVVVRVTFAPPDQRYYDIESSRGGVGARVLRDILVKEMEEPNAEAQKWLTLDNYNFRLLGHETVDGHPCYVLALAPKREERNVIRGRAWIDVESYRIRRLEGEPVKIPSWWIHDLYFTMSFDQVDGVWMRTLTHATADVRFKGKYVMVARNVDSSPRPSASSLPKIFDLNGSAVLPQ